MLLIDHINTSYGWLHIATDIVCCAIVLACLNSLLVHKETNEVNITYLSEECHN